MLALSLSAQTLPVRAAPQWIALFNGKNLDNFDIAYSSKPVDGRPASAMFEVKDGVVVVPPGPGLGIDFAPEVVNGLQIVEEG